MVKVNLPGIKKATSKGRVYYYHRASGKRLEGEPGTEEFILSYNEAQESVRTPDASRFRSLVILYKASSDYRNLAASTKQNWGPWLDRISDHFGDLRIAHFDRPDKIRPAIIRWRNQYAEKPRAADYGLQVLSRVLSYAVDPLGQLGRNPCEGIKRLYSADRSEIIWTDADIDRLKATCSAEIAHAVDLAAHTGLRLGDLLRLSWSHVNEAEGLIAIRTGKSRQKREAIIPLYNELRLVLARIPKRSTAVLTNSRHKPWSEDGFGSVFNKAKKRAGIDQMETPLRFHDLRGTAATKFYIADLRIREIAEIMGWEEETVEKIIRRYVGRAAATKDLIRRMNAATAKKGTDLGKPTGKPGSRRGA